MVPDKVNLIAIDLDGTLVRNDENRILPEEAEAVRHVEETGVTVVIATGRPHLSAAEVLRRIGLGTTPIISYNGAMVRRPEEAEPMMHLTLPHREAGEVLSLAVERKLYALAFGSDEIFVTHLSKWGRTYWQQTGLRPKAYGDLRPLAETDLTKIIVMDEPPTISALATELSERWKGRLYVTKSRHHMVEFINPEANKGAAFRWLADHLGVSMDQTAALGDGENDVPLLEAAAYGVSMPGADEALVPHADLAIEDGHLPVQAALRKIMGADL